MNARLRNFGLTPDDVHALNNLEKGLGTLLHQHLVTVGERLEAGSGKRGKLHKASDIKLNSNILKGVADAVDDQDAVNLRTLLRFRQCDFLLDTLDQCFDFEDEQETTTSAASVQALTANGYFFAYCIRPPESTLAGGGLGGIKEFLAWYFFLPYAVQANRFITEITTAAAGREPSFGIYNSSGVLVFDFGQVSAGIGIKNISFSNYTFNPGSYYLAVISGGINHRTLGGISARDAYPIINHTTVRCGSGGVQATYVMPGTVPTLTAFTTIPPLCLIQKL